MDVTKTLHVTDREEWRDWLKEHYRNEKEIWLVFHRKHTGEPRIPYDDAVEEALCFGWIDSTVKGLDQERYAQRFSPRRARSGYSQANKERLRMLIADGQVVPEVLDRLTEVDLDEFEYPPGIMAAIRANERAWENFRRYSGPYQRIRIAYIASTRDRPEEYEKRLRYFLRMTEQDKQFGHGIEHFYGRAEVGK